MFKTTNHCPVCGGSGSVNFKSRDWEYELFDTDFDFFLCKECQVLCLSLLPEKAYIKHLYPSNYSGYQSLGAVAKIAQKLARYLKVRKLKSVLGMKSISDLVEIGPGGNPMLVEGDNFGARITYVDLPGLKYDYLKSNGVRYIETEDASLLGADILGVDVIVANQLVEHVLNPNELIKNCSNAMKSGGILFLETPNIESAEFKIFGKNGTWGGFHAPKHFSVFGKKSIRCILERNNFEIISFQYILSPFLWAESLKAYFSLKGLGYISPLFSLKNPFALFIYIFVDSFRIAFKGTTSNLRVIARRKS